MSDGTNAEPLQSAALVRDRESHSGVSIGDDVAGSSFDSTSTASARSPSASRSSSVASAPD